MNFWKNLFGSKESQKDRNPNKKLTQSPIDSNPYSNNNHVVSDSNDEINAVKMPHINRSDINEKVIRNGNQRNVLYESTGDAEAFMNNGMRYLGQGITNHDAN